jgi:hypothetical protein
MASAIAENIVNSHTQVVQSILNSTTQSCIGNCNALIENDFYFCDNTFNGPVEIGGSSQQQCLIDTNCVQDSSTNNCVSGILSQSVVQTAKALQQSVLFSRNEIQSSNITYLLTQYTQAIYNSFSQSCLASAQNQITNNVCLVHNTFAENLSINFDNTQTINIAIQCTQESEAVSTAKASLQNYITQVAESEQAGILTPAVVIAIIICATVVISFLGKTSAFKLILIFLALLFGVGVYFLVAWLIKIPPFAPEVECYVDPQFLEDRDTSKCKIIREVESEDYTRYPPTTEEPTTLLLTEEIQPCDPQYNKYSYPIGSLRYTGTITNECNCGENGAYKTGATHLNPQTGLVEPTLACRETVSVNQTTGAPENTNNSYINCAQVGLGYITGGYGCTCRPGQKIGDLVKYSNTNDKCVECPYGLENDNLTCKQPPPSTSIASEPACEACSEVFD